jgi:hypothetical protein
MFFYRPAEKHEDVKAGLVPAIHDFSDINGLKAWMAALWPP